MKKSLSAAIVFGVTAALVLAGASAATAAAPDTLPDGQTLYAIECDRNVPQLWSVGPDGASTPVGDSYQTGEGVGCAGGAQTNPVDGITYFIYFTGEGDTVLASVNLTTGVVSTIDEISGATRNAFSLVITKTGEAFVVGSEILYGLSLTTGVTTRIGSIAPALFGPLGYDALTDTIYSFDYSEDVVVYTIDRETGEATNTDLSGTWPSTRCLNGGSGSGVPLSVAFDSAGFAWIMSGSCIAVIMTFDMSTGDSAARGELQDSTQTLYPDDSHTFYSQTFFIGTAAVAAADTAPAAPALAATGFNSGAIAVAGGIGAIVILLGAALLFRSRRKA